jgi:hypothetical protein
MTMETTVWAIPAVGVLWLRALPPRVRERRL